MYLHILIYTAHCTETCCHVILVSAQLSDFEKALLLITLKSAIPLYMKMTCLYEIMQKTIKNSQMVSLKKAQSAVCCS